MVCLVGSLDGLDFGRLRFHRVSDDHGANTEELHVPLPAVALLTIKLWMRLVGAVAAGWLADRVGRKNGRLAYRVLSGLAST
jgi:MFS family permease